MLGEKAMKVRQILDVLFQEKKSFAGMIPFKTFEAPMFEADVVVVVEVVETDYLVTFVEKQFRSPGSDETGDSSN